MSSLPEQVAQRPNHNVVKENSDDIQVNRELSTLPIPSSVVTNLTRAGLMMVGDVITLKPSVLGRDANITEKQSSEVLQKIYEHANTNASFSNASSAWELFQKERNTPSIVTFCESLDDMLDGGIPLTKITEFCGIPGTGKTQMCLQLCIDVQMPTEQGGQEGEAIYIDTEGGFIVDRLTDIALATVEHCRTVLNETESGRDLADFTLDRILHGIHYFRCHDPYELMAVLHQIPEIIKTHPKVKLLVVDNIASPVRQEFEDMLAQNQFLSFVGQTFIKLAKQFEIAVVLTNQMTTKVDSINNKSHVIPALGETWSHIANLRIILSWDQSLRKALLYKSTNKKETSCSFQITTSGIRDVIVVKPNDSKHSSSSGGLKESGGLTELMDTDVHREKRESQPEDRDSHPSKRTRIF